MQHFIFGRDRFRVAVDSATGALREIGSTEADISLITQPDVAAQHPFMIVFADGTTSSEWKTCSVKRAEETSALIVHWSLEGGLDLTVRLTVDVRAGELRCNVELKNPARLPVAAVAYPYIAGIGRLGAAADHDELVHPYATGFLVRNPLDSLPSVISETDGRQPVVLGLYPEGFSGATMQFMSYSAVGLAGFYIATEDAAGKEKWLNFYRHPQGDLRLAVWHTPDDYGDHCEVSTTYDTVLAVLEGGTWYDAADRYKSWAHLQSWVAQGPLWAQEDRCRWLVESVGLCTFGINPRYNRAPWLNEIDRIAGTPVLHIVGPNWTRTGADYMNHLPGDLEDWFPACFHPENVELMRRNGDYLVPFEFDLLFGKGEHEARSAAGTEALQIIPRPTLSRDAYDFPFLCPATDLARDLHVERDRVLVQDYGVGGVYYDISVNNVRHVCASTMHHHRPGDTTFLTGAFRDLFADTSLAMRQAAGNVPVPQGTEMINEQMIPCVQFYQARAEASPAAPFEAGPFRELIKAGRAEKIPLFAYVYHEYGPVRLDGWAKLSREQGDFVFFVLGRVFVQGGLIELNYEFSSLEDLDDARDVSAEHYYRFDERRLAIDPEVAAFVGRLSTFRLGRANRYLGYGSMQRPSPLRVFGVPALEVDYYLYNCSTADPGYEEHGVMRVPAVLQSAWSYRGESHAWVLLNISRQELTVELTITPPCLGSDHHAKYQLAKYGENEAVQRLGRLGGTRTIALTLAPRSPIVLEATRPVQENL